MSKRDLNFTNERYSINHVKQAFGVETVDIKKFESGKHGFACGKLSGPMSSKVDVEELTQNPEKFQIAVAVTEEGEELAILCPLGYEAEVVAQL